MKVVNGNLFNTEYKVIAHQVNCQGVMGSGVAAQVKQLYPFTYQEYKSLYNERNPEECLGHALIVKETNKYILNVYGQLNFGVGLQTNYAAVRSGFLEGILNLRNTFGFDSVIDIAVPYKFGCDRGGGNWNKMTEILEEIEGIANVRFTAYRLEI